MTVEEVKQEMLANLYLKVAEAKAKARENPEQAESLCKALERFTRLTKEILLNEVQS